MMQLTYTNCPKCDKEVLSLEYWKHVGKEYLHLCSACVKLKKMSQEDLLKIGFAHGYRKAKEDFIMMVKLLPAS